MDHENKDMQQPVAKFSYIWMKEHHPAWKMLIIIDKNNEVASNYLVKHCTENEHATHNFN